MLRQGALAYQHGRLFVEAGLELVACEAIPVVLGDPAQLGNAMGLRGWARVVTEAGELSPAEVARWERALDNAAAGGYFLYAFGIFLTAGRRLA